MIHINDLRKLLQVGLEFTMEYIAEDGRRIRAENIRMTSSNFKRNTINVRHTASGVIRTVRIFQIVSYNGTEVFL